MALKQDQTGKEYPINVTNDDKGKTTERGQESSSIQEIITRRVKKRTIEIVESTEEQIEKRQKGEKLENEETLLRDKLLEEIYILEPSQNAESLTSTKGSTCSDMEENSNGETTFFQDRKIIKLKGKLPNLALPDGWLALNHRSGGIIYLHRSTRVCTWSRPYYIGKGSVRKHDVPIAAIPCLHQKKALENESNENSLQKDPSEQIPQSQVSGSVLNFINTAGVPPNDADLMLQHDSGIDRTGISGSQEADNGRVSGRNGHGGDRGGNNEWGGGNGRGGGDDAVVVGGGVDGGGDGSGGVGGEDRYGSSGDSGDGSDDGGNKVDVVMNVNCSISRSDSDDRGGVSGSNKVDSVDGGFQHSHVESRNSDKDEALGSQNIIPKIFHPKDGLDLVNDTLSVNQSLQKIENYFSKPFERETLISSSEAATALEKFASRSMSDSTMKKVTQTDLKNDKIFDADNMTLHQIESLKPKKKMSTDTLTKTTDQKLEPKGVSTESNSGIELVDSEELNVYLERLFDFEELTREQEQNVVIATADKSSELEESSLPPLLDCLPYCVKGVDARQNKEWVLNPGGKTPIAILHEYSQAVLKTKPEYVFSECDNPSAPFVAEVQIDGITHGTGQATNKKQAKQAAAEATLQVFLPDEFKKIRDYQISPEELEYFDKLKIDHPNVYEVSIKSGLPSPSDVLQKCLKRNQGVCDQVIKFKIIPGENKNEHTYRVSCGKHSAEGLCKNKKVGKQLAAQALLKKLHPHVSTWGSLLRIYCDRPSTVVKKYKTAGDDVLMCKPQQCSSGDTSRGEFLLARLREEMKKIADDRKQDKKRRPQSNNYKKDNPISTVDI